MARRPTIRFNDVEEAELELLKKTFHIDDDSKAVKLAVEWVNHYIKNVSNTFFPPSFDVVLVKKKKNEILDRKIY
ncbi:hypothetical protein HOC01_03840 [archaeon]|jgi:hypothetical protein|nr:hypothetical protein [archaeon]MBT6698455.1 hypothetical protein [archaeon]